MRLVITVLLFLLASAANGAGGGAKMSEGGAAEVVFLLDRSGSVGAAHFEAEKGFVESFLAQVAVHANATRVAVISYSDDAVVHVDYLSAPRSKCELSEALREVEYADSRATNIRAALDAARRVLRNARPRVRKVVLLITDGVANVGGAPGESARLLKEEDGAELICVGVGREAKAELLALASSPAHLYSCSGFKDFRRLARQIRGDPHESGWSSEGEKQGCDHLCDSPYKGQADDPGCCDPHARCSCSLKAGLRHCVCAPGYFGLSGLRGRCLPCPLGSYKSKLEPVASCTPCPKGSTTLGVASTSPGQCVCKEGFRRPNPGDDCTKVRCPALQAPPRGFAVGECAEGAAFGGQCLFGCDAGFEISGDDVRTCTADGTWSGRTASCQRVECAAPTSPSLVFRCNSQTLVAGTRCRFSCPPGYLLQGSEERECLDSRRWSGDPATCVPVRCELPPPLANGWSSCSSRQRPEFGQWCAFRCHHGFKLLGPHLLHCAQDGRLTPPHQRLICKDVTPPELLCPASFAVAAEPGQRGASVSWRVPLPSDNGPVPPSLRHPSPRPPLFLGVGEHVLKYVAEDAEGLFAVCTFSVRVYDAEPPRVVSCPEAVVVSGADRSVAVFWEEPRFSDPSPLTVEASRRPGDLFSVGEESVTYLATDRSGNTAECTFSVKVSPTTCPFFPAPANGALSCDDLHWGSLCLVSCEDRFDFAAPPANLYVCNGEGRWNTDPMHLPMPWPDCTKPVTPGMLRVKAHGFYFHGDCRSPSAQAQIRKQFARRLTERVPEAQKCFLSGRCTLETVRVICGKRRAKRDLLPLQGEDLELEFEITLNNDLQLNETEAVLRNFLEAIQQLDWREEEEEELATTTTPEKEERVVITEESAEVVCRPGSVSVQDKCMLCPGGTYFSAAGGECSECPLGHFQEKEGALECQPCPDGTSTEHPRAKNRTECKGVCPAGTFSASGLETCLACPVGTFQPQVGQSRCEFCPGTTTTLTVQSASPRDCRERCAAGHFSPLGGLQPCTPCPLGSFQPSLEQTACLECPGNLSTLAEAATDVTQCQEGCPSDWCLQGGSCVEERKSPLCICPEGWEGRRCERDVDECLHNPCLNGARCNNTDGSFECACAAGFRGRLCEEEVDECLSAPCLNNATCVDEVDGFRCLCPGGFRGDLCQVARESCSLHDVECANGGRCAPSADHPGETECACAAGYAGADCSIEMDECEGVLCLNNGTCVDGVGSFRCACAPGFRGALCESEVDECAEGGGCAEGATCLDLVAGFECICPPGWGGDYCETRLSDDFVLHFPAPSSLANLAQLRLRARLAQATVSLWVQTEAGSSLATPLSYAAPPSDDNAMTLSDCGALTLSLNDEPLHTEAAVDDGAWHHLAFAYDDAGSWQLWKDGRLASEGRRRGGGAPVEGGGALVLGQEQDSVGGGFSLAEAFTGNISRVNVWSAHLSPGNVSRLCRLDDDLPDDRVVAWPDFLPGVSGDVRVLAGQRPEPFLKQLEALTGQ